MGSMLTVNMN